MRGYRKGRRDLANSLSLLEWGLTTLHTGLLRPHPGDGLWQQGQCLPPSHPLDRPRLCIFPAQPVRAAWAHPRPHRARLGPGEGAEAEVTVRGAWSNL